ncbi:MAG: acyl-CoA synthetase [Chloroflexi bacterium]|nr:MAG: acyl-CoA synthetase [Chloroflexota bacterium]
MAVYRTELNPADFLTRSAWIYPAKTAIVHGERRYTYRQFAERVNRFASRLRALGLQKHDRVAVLSPNTPAMLEATLAVPAAGGILTALNTRISTPEIGYILEHSGAPFLFVDHELEPMLTGLDLSGLTVVRIADTGLPDDPYEEFLAAGSPDAVASWLEDEYEPLALNYTSGTTGRPKGVLYHYRGAYLNALGEVIEAGLSRDSVYLWTLPMFHCNGWCFPWAVTAVGGTHVCLRRVDARRIWELFDSEGVTHYCGAPTVHITIVNCEYAHTLPRPVTGLIAAAPPSPTLMAQLRALNLHPVHVYGLTETYGPMTVCERRPEWAHLTDEEQATFLSRQGQAYIVGDLVRVVGEDMADVPRDGETLGEVVMRGNNVMLGYYKAPEATAEAFRGGWFHSGDLAVWHPNGDIELRDRSKDIIISGGENISTIEVEQALMAHPAVLECAVVAVPHPHWGERPKAFVTLKPGQSVTEGELIAFARSRIAHFKCPDTVAFGDLPKTSTGKVQKYVLREREWAGHAKRIN